MSPLRRYEPPRRTSRTDIFKIHQLLGEILTKSQIRVRNNADGACSDFRFLHRRTCRSGMSIDVFSATFVNGLSIRAYTRGVLS